MKAAVALATLVSGAYFWFRHLRPGLKGERSGEAQAASGRPGLEFAVRFEPHGEPGHLRAWTDGLAGAGRPELEVVGLPEARREAAELLLRTVASYTLGVKEIRPGESIAGDLGPAHYGCQCVAASGPEGARLRLVELGQAAGVELPPRMALATVMYARALAAEDAGASAVEVEDELLSAAELFPGENSRREDSLASAARFVFNHGNHLVYLAMARRDAENADRWYRLALQRCALLQAHEQGAPELPEVAAERLARDILHLAKASWAAQEGRANGAGFQRAPLLEPDDTLGGSSSALPGVPRSLARDTGPRAMARFDAEPALVQVVVDAYARARREPIEVLVETRALRELHLGQGDAGTAPGTAPRRPRGERYEAHHKMVSTLLADVSRKLAAGLTVEELRASLRLDEDEAARHSGTAKLARLETERR